MIFESNHNQFIYGICLIKDKIVIEENGVRVLDTFGNDYGYIRNLPENNKNYWLFSKSYPYSFQVPKTAFVYDNGDLWNVNLMIFLSTGDCLYVGTRYLLQNISMEEFIAESKKHNSIIIKLKTNQGIIGYYYLFFGEYEEKNSLTLVGTFDLGDRLSYGFYTEFSNEMYPLSLREDFSQERINKAVD